MKTISYILLALVMTVSFTSCTSDSIADNLETPTDEVATTGENGHVEDEDQGGGN
ncbi:hypothetical protein [Aquimarina aggregata]|uniref:hypothetical protein n=1 Tax=Aquimarina aggregata TaxID=1642818 RepID=UPI0024911B96|nr:hypothetical protein [Aquimarina aggregata]